MGCLNTGCHMATSRHGGLAVFGFPVACASAMDDDRVPSSEP